MKKLLLLLALVAGTTAAHAQAAPGTDASGAPLINKGLPAPGLAAPPAPTGPPLAGRRAPQPPDQQAARQSQRLAQQLGLSASQQGQVQQILLGQYQQQAAARQQVQATGQRRGMGRALHASRAQADDQLRGVLTPDQYGRYQQLLAQRKQSRGRQGQPLPPGPTGGPLD